MSGEGRWSNNRGMPEISGTESRLREDAAPRFFGGGIHRESAGCAHGAEDRQEDDGLRAGVAGGVRCVFRDVSDLARTEEAFLIAHPLFRAALEEVDNFLATGMDVKFVDLTGLEGGADEEEMLRADEFLIGHPLYVA